MSEQNDSALTDELTPVQLNALAPLDKTAQKIVAAIEQYWWTSKKILTESQIVSLLGLELEYVRSVLQHPSFFQTLRTKGIITVSEDSRLLTGKQILAANMVLTRADTRSLREKLKDVGVTVTEWNGWLSTKAFHSYISARSTIDFETADHSAFKTLLDSVEQGDLAATKLYFEMRGKYTPRMDLSINVGLLLTQIVEVVANFVSPEQMEELAVQMEALYSAHTGKQLENTVLQIAM